MSIIFPAGDNPAAIIERARRLADDVERLVSDGGPSASDLAAAPVLDLWRPARRLSTGLLGVVRGHPFRRDGSVCHTSEIYALCPGVGAGAIRGWARSYSRYYALGRDIDGAGWSQ